MNIPRIMIAAPASGSGKTMVTCALLQHLKDENINVRAFKCGPDYIDPMFHRSVLGCASDNIDVYFSGEEGVRRILFEESSGYDLAVIEGVMGLFDGLGGVSEEASSYHVAKATGTNIILVINAHGMGRSIVPLIKGYLSYDSDKLIKGVILNKISKSYYDMIKPVIEAELDIVVAGFVPDNESMSVGSRHLGLLLPNEIADLQLQMHKAGKLLSDSVDIKLILQLANSNQPSKSDQKDNYAQVDEYDRQARVCIEANDGHQLTLAVARDEAFCFYYEANIREFEKRGVRIVYFSPLHDESLPEAVDGILLGGGYPENYAAELSKNVKMKNSLRSAIEHGVPSLAECGGFMYLHSELIDDKNNSYSMLGILPDKVSYKGKLVRFGYAEYISSNSSEQHKCGGHGLYKIKGHEFHYYDSTDNGADYVARKPVGMKSWECIHSVGNNIWGFPHLYYASCPEFVEDFIKKMENSHRFFENKECKYYPCHEMDGEMNCLFCYCPLYRFEKCLGNPEFIQKGERTIKVCTNCNFPHKPENYDKVIEFLKTH